MESRNKSEWKIICSLQKDLADSLLYRDISCVWNKRVTFLFQNQIYGSCFKFAIVAVIVYPLIRYVGEEMYMEFQKYGKICVRGAVYYVVIIVFRYFFINGYVFFIAFFEPATFLSVWDC